MINCVKNCPGYRKCLGLPWYSYYDIKWCSHQVKWILENLLTFQEGNWPDSPDKSTYVDPSIKGALKAEAYYTKPAIVLGEVEARIISERVGQRLTQADWAGRLLVAELRSGYELSEESKLILAYLSGWKRKKITYAQWKALKNQYQKRKN